MRCPYRFGICTMAVLMGMFVGTFVLFVRDGRKTFAAKSTTSSTSVSRQTTSENPLPRTRVN
jgi:hypothetical protein